MIAFVLPFILDFAKLSDEEYVFVMITISLAVLFVVFIVLRNRNSTSVHYVSSERPRLSMIRLNNPFILEVNLKNASFEGVQCTFSSSKNCCVLALWGVPISSLFEFLNFPWRRMKSIIDSPMHSNFLSECTAYMDPIFLNAKETQTTVFRPPVECDKNLLTCNQLYERVRYPFVAVMVLQNNWDVQERNMMVIASALHLPDSWMKNTPYIIGKFIRPVKGPVGYIQKTYLSPSETMEQNGETVSLCTVCYNNIVSLVILPCGHACVCDTCLKFCENCPICRQRWSSYFDLAVSNS